MHCYVDIRLGYLALTSVSRGLGSQQGFEEITPCYTWCPGQAPGEVLISRSARRILSAAGPQIGGGTAEVPEQRRWMIGQAVTADNLPVRLLSACKRSHEFMRFRHVNDR